MGLLFTKSCPGISARPNNFSDRLCVEMSPEPADVNRHRFIAVCSVFVTSPVFQEALLVRREQNVEFQERQHAQPLKDSTRS
jgi:hypothetical protein